jgi:hypothetical protein
MQSFQQYIQFKNSQFDNKLYDSKNNTVYDMISYMYNNGNKTTQEIFEILLNSNRLFDEKHNKLYNNALFHTFTTRLVGQFAENIDISNIFDETNEEYIIVSNIAQSHRRRTPSTNKFSHFVSRYQKQYPRTSVFKTSYDKSY